MVYCCYLVWFRLRVLDDGFVDLPILNSVGSFVVFIEVFFVLVLFVSVYFCLFCVSLVFSCLR